MSIYAKQNSNNNNITNQIVPSGTHIARCFQIIHIGTIAESYQGVEKMMEKVRLVFELPLELNENGNGEKPFIVGREFTLSMHEKSSLRAFVQGWEGRSFSDYEASKFDIGSLMNKDCILNVIHRTSSSGKIYADVKGASPLMKGMICPPMINKPFILDYDDKDFDKNFSILPKWIQDKVSSSKEYIHRKEQMLKITNSDKVENHTNQNEIPF